jgi:uncharacterized iron-regulated membrane protein
MATSVAFWRQWHRWIGLPATIFLLWAATTGFLVAFTEFFGAEEALRERTRDLVSPVTVASPAAALADPLSRAVAAVAARGAGAPVDKIEMTFKGDEPTVTIYTGRPTGGEDRKFVVDARTGRIVSEEAYADKPLLYRLHSGEAFGDGGLVMAMGWALALVALTISGLLIWWRLRRPEATGIRRWFW